MKTPARIRDRIRKLSRDRDAGRADADIERRLRIERRKLRLIESDRTWSEAVWGDEIDS